MQAIRQVQFTTSDILQIQLPPEFINRTVEVIVLLDEKPQLELSSLTKMRFVDFMSQSPLKEE